MSDELYTARLSFDTSKGTKGDMLTRDGVVVVATLDEWNMISIVSDFAPASELPEGTKTVPLVVAEDD